MRRMEVAVMPTYRTIRDISSPFLAAPTSVRLLLGRHLGGERRQGPVHDERASAAAVVQSDGALGDGRLHLEGGLAVPNCHRPPGGIHSPARDQLAVRRNGQVEGILEAVVSWIDRARPLPRDLADVGDARSAGRGQGGAAGQDGEGHQEERAYGSVPCRSHVSPVSYDPDLPPVVFWHLCICDDR